MLKKLRLSLKSYVEKVIDKFDMNNSKVVTTPSMNQFNLSLNEFLKTNEKIK